MAQQAYAVGDAGTDQIINGHVFDFSSIDIALDDGQPFSMPGIFEISYEHSLTPGEIRHVGPLVQDESVGTYATRASISMALRDWRVFRSKLAQIKTGAGSGPGFMQKRFNVVVSYAEDDEVPMTDMLVKCRVMRVGRAYRRSNEALAVNVELYVRRIVEDGVEAVASGNLISDLAMGTI